MPLQQLIIGDVVVPVVTDLMGGDSPVEALSGEELTFSSAVVPAPNAIAGGTKIWSSPQSVLIDDALGSVLSFSFAISTDTGMLLSGISKPIPTGAVIVGLEVIMNKSQQIGGGDTVDHRIQLQNNGSLIGAGREDTVTLWPNPPAKIIHGSPTNRWGMGAAMTPAIINSPTFGLVIQSSQPTADANITSLIYVGMKVYYN